MTDSTTQDAAETRWWSWGLSLGVALAVGLVFWPARHGALLTWDDDVNITRNELIKGLDGERLWRMFTDVEQAMRYKPLSWLAWAVLYRLVGESPQAYHVVNVALHALNAGLFCWAAGWLLRWSEMRGRRLSREGQADPWPAAWKWGSGFAALAWALHPLRVEPVAWATGLPYGLSLALVLMSLLLYLRGRAAEAPQRAWTGWDWGALGCYALAVLTYPMVLSYPLVLPVLERYVLPKGSWRSALRAVPYVMLSGLFVAVALLARLDPAGIWGKASSMDQFGWMPRVMQAFYIWGYYVWKPLWPADLSPLYTQLDGFDPWGGSFIGSMVAVVGLTVWLYSRRGHWPSVWLGWLGHLLLLIPVLGLTEHPHFPSDRYGLVAALSMSLFAGAWFARSMANRRWRWWGLGMSLVVLTCLTVATRRQLPVWRTDVSLFHHMLSTTAGTSYEATSRFRLAQALGRVKDYAGAAEHWALLLETHGHNPDVLHEAASAYQMLGRWERAAGLYGKAAERMPADALIRVNWGAALAELGRLPEALEQFRHAARLRPDLAVAHRNVEAILRRLGREEEAEAYRRDHPAEDRP